MEAQVVVYGASGYTGKLICWQLAEEGIPFVAAGRSQLRLKEQMARVPELGNARFECVEVAHDEEALTKLFAGKKVVYNVVGPFMQLSKPVAKAALNAGCHYFDTTGEGDWVRWLRDELGKEFKSKGLLCAPATSWMWLAGEMAAEIALETSGVDSLELLYLGGADVSVASAMSFFRMLANKQYYLKNGVLEEWPPATAYTVNVPGRHEILTALPWGGGVEPLIYERDHRVRNCRVLTAMNDPNVTQFIIGQLKMIEEKYPGISRERREEITNEIGNRLVSTEPAREQQDKHYCLISCHGRGRTQSVSVTLHGNCPYIQTGIFAATATREVLAGRQRKSGFSSACGAFGYRVFLRAIVEKGYLTSKYVQ